VENYHSLPIVEHGPLLYEKYIELPDFISMAVKQTANQAQCCQAMKIDALEMT
jgi:hypothetical protein